MFSRVWRHLNLSCFSLFQDVSDVIDFLLSKNVVDQKLWDSILAHQVRTFFHTGIDGTELRADLCTVRNNSANFLVRQVQKSLQISLLTRRHFVLAFKSVEWA